MGSLARVVLAQILRFSYEISKKLIGSLTWNLAWHLLVQFLIFHMKLIMNQ